MMIVNLLEVSFVAIKHVDNVLLLMLLMMVIIVNLWEMNFVLSSSMLNMLMPMMMTTMTRSLAKMNFVVIKDVDNVVVI